MIHVTTVQARVPFLGVRAKKEGLDSNVPDFFLENLPGEFAKDAILNIAASAFDVSRHHLARALSLNVISSVRRHHDPEVSRTLLDILAHDAEIQPLTGLACALAAAIVSKELTNILTLPSKVAFRADIEPSVASNYLVRLLRAECVSVCADLIAFELNTGSEHGLISSSDHAMALGEMRALVDDPEYMDYVCEKYPLLRERLATRLELVTKSAATTMERIAKHWDDIVATFGIKSEEATENTWAVRSIEPSSGDSHNGANRVTFIHFANGRSIVYKPRSVHGESRFQDYLRFLEECDPTLSFRKLTVLPCEGYGWVEFVASKDAECEGGIREYYFRYGALLAAFDAISGTDIHFENLVAEGSHPVIVDLETIFQPSEIRSAEEGKSQALLSLDFYHDTPLITAMFDPVFLNGSPNGSPLSRAILVPSSELIVTTIEERFAVAPARMDAQRAHMPCLAGTPVPFDDYVSDIMRGFRQMAALIVRYRSKLVGGGLHNIFSGGQVRVIFRHTKYYAAMVKAVNSAYAMQSLRNTEEILSRLWRTVSVTPDFTSIIAAEHFDIWNGDVPYFESDIGSSSARSSEGKTIEGIFSKGGWAATMSRVLAKDQWRITQESNLIEFCLRAKVKDTAGAPTARRESDVALSQPPKEPETILKAVQTRLMLQEGRVLAMDIVMHRDHRTRLSALGPDLYTGTAGICLALAYGDPASRSGSPSPELRALCDASLSAVGHESMLETGICYGHGAGIYMAAHLSALWSDPYMQMLGEHLAEQATRVLYTDRHFDLFSGSAGLLCALLALRGGASAGKLDALIESTVDHLINHSHTSRGAMAWMSSIPSTGPTTGYAHGVSGIAHALLRAGVELDIKRAIDAAMGAARFLEACRFDGAGWRECESDSAPAKLDTWCHGTPGIGLFYQELAAVCPSEQIQKTALFALTKIEQMAPFENDSLCHGWLGNLEALLISQTSSQSEMRKAAVQTCLDELAGRTIRCGNEHHHTSLGLFTGYSGIAYQRLRCEAPEVYPSVLTFAPPIR